MTKAEALDLTYAGIKTLSEGLHELIRIELHDNFGGASTRLRDAEGCRGAIIAILSGIYGTRRERQPDEEWTSITRGVAEEDSRLGETDWTNIANTKKRG